MTTADMAIPQDGSWLGIPTLGGSTILYNASTQHLLVRLGSTSTSYGMKLFPDQTMMFDETVYVKPILDGSERSGSLRVSR